MAKGDLLSLKWQLMAVLQGKDFRKVFERLLHVGEAARVDILLYLSEVMVNLVKFPR